MNVISHREIKTLIPRHNVKNNIFLLSLLLPQVTLEVMFVTELLGESWLADFNDVILASKDTN